MPPATVALGRQDQTALLLVNAYRKAVGVGDWVGLRGEGEFTPNAPDSSGDASGADPATLSIMGGRRFRLDIQKSEGLSSLRFAGYAGAMQHEGRGSHSIDARNAASGLFAFPRLLKATFPEANVALIDQGVIQVDGAPFHRVTMGIAWRQSPNANPRQPEVTVIDLYFDPQTALLSKSATADVGSTAETTRYLRVMSYSDYRPAGGMRLPYLYSETFNGQHLWTLQLNTIALTNGLSESDFHF